MIHQNNSHRSFSGDFSTLQCWWHKLEPAYLSFITMATWLLIEQLDEERHQSHGTVLLWVAFHSCPCGPGWETFAPGSELTCFFWFSPEFNLTQILRLSVALPVWEKGWGRPLIHSKLYSCKAKVDEKHRMKNQCLWFWCYLATETKLLWYQPSLADRQD